MDVSDGKQRTYGGWARPRTAGYGSWSVAETLLAFVGLPVVLVVWQVLGFYVALVVLLLLGVGFYVIHVKDRRHGLTLAEKIGERFMWRRKKKRGEHVYRSSLQSPSGEVGLPGVLARTSLSEHEDAFGRPFALLKWSGMGAYTVVFVTEPTGKSLVDSSVVDSWVANFAEFLGSLGDTPEILQAQVVVETTPDTGGRLAREIHSNMGESVPLVSREMFDEIIETYPVGGTRIRAYLALTVDARPYTGAKARGDVEMARDMAAYIASLSQMLPSLGSGQTVPLDSYGLCRLVRCAYDPAALSVFDEAEIAGERLDVSWSEAGPVATQMSDWQTYMHDSGVSSVWMMTSAPRQNVHADVLEPLLKSDSFFVSKRVSLLYRPIEAGRASDVAQKDRNNAVARANQGKVSDTRSRITADNAQATAEEEATGAGLGELGIVVSATVDDVSKLERGREKIMSLARQSKILLRPAYGSSDAMFVASLPLGMLPEKYSSIPDYVRESL